MGKKRKAKRKQKSNTGKLIAGGLLVGEGTLFALYGNRYLRFLERYGLLDAGKAAIRKLDIQSPIAFAALGIAETLWGIGVLRRAHL